MFPDTIYLAAFRASRWEGDGFFRRRLHDRCDFGINFHNSYTNVMGVTTDVRVQIKLARNLLTESCEKNKWPELI